MTATSELIEPSDQIDASDDPDEVGEADLVATTAPGIAQEHLIRLVAADVAVRRFFGELGHRSGVVQRNTIRLGQVAFERRFYQELGVPDPDYPQFLEALNAWARMASGDSSEPVMTNAEIETEIGRFLADRHLPWPWLSRSTIGAFTWHVDALVRSMVGLIGDALGGRGLPADSAAKPTDLPVLEFWYWNEADGPRLPTDRVFPGVHLYRGDTFELARARVQSHVDEVERFLATIEGPAVPLGRKPDKRRAKIVRDVGWFYRNAVEGTPKAALAKEAFGADEPDPKKHVALARDRNKDVRDGIATAKRLLAGHPFEQPILTLDEYEAGRSAF